MKIVAQALAREWLFIGILAPRAVRVAKCPGLQLRHSSGFEPDSPKSYNVQSSIRMVQVY